MVGVEEGREFRFRGDLYSQESTLPLVNILHSLCVILFKYSYLKYLLTICFYIISFSSTANNLTILHIKYAIN